MRNKKAKKNPGFVYIIKLIEIKLFLRRLFQL